MICCLDDRLDSTRVDSTSWTSPIRRSRRRSNGRTLVLAVLAMGSIPRGAMSTREAAVRTITCNARRRIMLVSVHRDMVCTSRAIGSGIGLLHSKPLLLFSTFRSSSFPMEGMGSSTFRDTMPLPGVPSPCASTTTSSSSMDRTRPLHSRSARSEVTCNQGRAFRSCVTSSSGLRKDRCNRFLGIRDSTRMCHHRHASHMFHLQRAS